MYHHQSNDFVSTLPKTPTGIDGLDDVTGGGLPTGRPTLICGSAGCGKTLMAMEFLVRGVTQFNENGVFIAFEETAEELTQNVRSLGFDLEQLIEQKKLDVDYIRIERGEIDEAGDYDLEGLFVRLGHAIDSIGAKRIVLDTIETLFGGLENQAILRSELRRLFRWLKDKGVTAVITGERGDGQLTRQGLEEYVSDCVISLDHRVIEQVSTRRLRIVKYRGTTHGTNEYPFLIDEEGISVLPLSSLGLNHSVSNKRISTGVGKLDEMFEGRGYFRGSSILVSGTAGCGKTSLASHLTVSTCAAGERVLYFSFEESAEQIMRNMKSIGLNLKKYVDQNLLQFHTQRSSFFGLEMHLVNFRRQINRFKPTVVVVDPISTMTDGGSKRDATAMVKRLIDYLKVEGVTAFLTSLTSGDAALERTSLDISSLVDTWLLLRDVEAGGERNRVMYILKSRGMAHSNQLREFLLTENGVQLSDVYLGADGVMTGSMRIAQQARERAAQTMTQQQTEMRTRELSRKRDILKAKVLALEAEFEAEKEQSKFLSDQAEADAELERLTRREMAVSRDKTEQAIRVDKVEAVEVKVSE